MAKIKDLDIAKETLRSI